MSERSQLAAVFVALALVVGALSLGVLGATPRPKIICVRLGGEPFSREATLDFAKEFHLPEDEIAAFLECAARGWDS